MNQAERFIEAFNQIENHLRRTKDSKTYLSFFTMVDDASYQDPMIRQYRDELRLFGNLRNAIIHSERKGGRPVADPREDVVKEIEKIAKMILEPPLVGEHFLGPVFSVSPEDKVLTVLQTMIEKDYSQAPIIKEDFIIGLMDFEAIARWVGAIHQEGIVTPDLESSTIADLLGSISRLKNFRVIKKDTDFVTARECFVDSLGTSNIVIALIITENGRRDEPPIGIITLSEDLEKIIGELRK
jgi:predicted transcriptional regulator